MLQKIKKTWPLTFKELSFFYIIITGVHGKGFVLEVSIFNRPNIFTFINTIFINVFS